jgi:hypothetical protein
MPVRWIFCALFLGILFPARAQPALTAQEIVDRVVARDKLLQQRRKAFDYDLTITREKLDDRGAVTSRTVEHQVVKGDHRPDYGTRNDPGAPEDAAKKAAHEEPFNLLDILGHYQYALDGEEEADGVLCYKIAFTPKPDMPYANREEKVLNAVGGHLWASKKDFSLVRNQGSLLHPVSVAWIFASLKQLDFQADTMPLPNGDAGPAQVQYSYDVGIPFSSIHERDTRRMSNYRPAGATAAGR